MKIYKAKITYTMDRNHPDIECVEWKKGKQFDFEDEYRIDERYFYREDDILSYIKNDLRLVAGGGYNSDHIHNVKFNINKV